MEKKSENKSSKKPSWEGMRALQKKLAKTGTILELADYPEHPAYQGTSTIIFTRKSKKNSKDS